MIAGVVGLVGYFMYIPVVTPNASLLVAGGFVILALATVLKAI